MREGAMNAMGGYTHMEAMGGGIFAKTAKATPLQSALRGFIAPNHADHPCVPHRGIPHATASGKGGMPNHNVINAHAFIATRYDKCATRHATSLLRRWAIHTHPMRWVAGYAHMGRWAGKPSRKPRRPRPYSRHCGDSSHGIAQTIHTIPMGACRTQPKSARAVYPQSQCNKCETRHAFITKRRDKCAMRYDNCATRHATSLLRPMRPAPPSITLRALGSKMPISPHGYRPPSYSLYEVCPRGYLRGVKWGIPTTNQHAQLY